MEITNHKQRLQIRKSRVTAYTDFTNHGCIFSAFPNHALNFCLIPDHAEPLPDPVSSVHINSVNPVPIHLALFGSSRDYIPQKDLEPSPTSFLRNSHMFSDLRSKAVVLDRFGCAEKLAVICRLLYIMLAFFLAF